MITDSTSIYSNYEQKYQMNKNMFCRFWKDGCGFISKNNQHYHGNSYLTRYCTIRAAMDIDGVNMVLDSMLKGKLNKKDNYRVLVAWIFKSKILKLFNTI